MQAGILILIRPRDLRILIRDVSKTQAVLWGHKGGNSDQKCAYRKRTKINLTSSVGGHSGLLLSLLLKRRPL